MEEGNREAGYAVVLEDIERRIAELQKTAENIRALMGLPAESVSSAGVVPQLPSSNQPKPFKGGDPISLVKIGDFYGKSYTEAAREFLKRVGSPQNTLTILSAMRQAAFEMKGKNPAGVLYTALTRHKGFVLVHRNTWGLAEWYPGAEKKKVEGKPTAKKSPKAKKATKKSDHEQPKLLEAPK